MIGYFIAALVLKMHEPGDLFEVKSRCINLSAQLAQPTRRIGLSDVLALVHLAKLVVSE